MKTRAMKKTVSTSGDLVSADHKAPQGKSGSGDLVSANQEAHNELASSGDLVSTESSSASKTQVPSAPIATRRSTRIRIATAKKMESAGQVSTKRKAAPAEKSAVKKPRTTSRTSVAVTETVTESSNSKVKGTAKAKAKSPAPKKATTATAKAPAIFPKLNNKKRAVEEAFSDDADSDIDSEEETGQPGPSSKKSKAPAPKKVKEAVAKKEATGGKRTRVKAIEHPLQNGVETETGSKEETEQPRPSSEKANAGGKAVAPKQIKRAITKTPSVINTVPSEILDVYVFGEGSASELGLGNAKNAINVKRPRLNPNLLAKEVGVVAIACGGMHSAVITHDNTILTWGVNDLGALGRDTTWNGGWTDAMKVDNNDSEDEDEVALNPHECKPGVVSSDHFPAGTKFVALACGDSSTFALTETGFVYGWGTFRGNEGVFGFSTTEPTGVQARPVLIEKVKDVTHIACGANHVLALTKKGEVWTWGSGEQNQLGHRIVERRKYDSLSPKLLRIGSGKVRIIGCGHYHSFAVDALKRVWVWGLNSFGQAGIPNEAGRDGAIVFSVVRMETLKLAQDEIIESITGGAHHSTAVTSLGRCFVWGRIDGNQMGLDISQIPRKDIIYDDRDKPRILIRPTPVQGLGEVTHIAAGTDHTLTVNREGKAYSWGFNVNYQCGQGNTDDIIIPAHIDNTATRGKTLIWAGAGGQFSALAGLSEFQR